MDEQQKKELQRHIDENKKFLADVLQFENSERAAVREQLHDFHRAIDEREKITDELFTKKQMEETKAFDDKSEELKKIISAKDETAMLQFMEKLKGKY